MGDSRGPGALRRLAALLIRGPEAAFVLADMEDAMERDLTRGVPLWRARWRYAVNVLGSAFSVGRGRVPGPRISWLDVKLGLRMLVKQPGLTSVAVFALAIGIPVGLVPGHAADMFETPPPFDQGDRIHILKHFNSGTARWEASSSHDYVSWQERLTSYEALGATTRGLSYNVFTDEGSAAPPIRGAELTASAFNVLRVRPLMGRMILPADEVVGAPDVVVLGYDLWQSRLEGDPGIVGQTIRIGGVQRTIIGVMPEGFLFPVNDHLWMPLRTSVLSEEYGEGRRVTIFGRLSDGVTPEQAQAEFSTVGVGMAAAFPDTHARLQPHTVPFTRGLFGTGREGLRGEQGFFAFQVLALMVLIVACANIGMLVFTRTATRASELAVRTALGASRTRVVSQLFAESLVLAVLAAGLGLFVADRLSGFRFDWLVNALPYWIDLGVNGKTVVSTLSLAVLSAAVVGVIPALKVTGKHVQRNLQRAAAGRSGMKFGGMSSALIIADIALVVAIVGVAAGLADQFTGAPDGMNIQADEFLAAAVELPQLSPTGDAAAFSQAEFEQRVGATHQALVQRLRAEPGIRGVTVGNMLPGMDHRSRRIELFGEEVSAEVRGPRVLNALVGVDFFDAFEQPILSGRGFDLGDLGDDRTAVIVNRNFVENILQGRNPIGRRFRYQSTGDGNPGPWHEIVGVVGHLGMNAVDPDGDAGVYHPLVPGELHPVLLAIHAGDDPQSFIPRLRTLASEIDPMATITAPKALDQVFSFNTYAYSWMKWGFGIFTGILLTLSASGIYALMSFTVSERTREIGLRTALGAQSTRIVLIIAKRALVQLAVGVLLGLIMASLSLWVLGGGGRIPLSTVTFALVAGVAVTVVIGGIACVVPTRRALRIMPTEALREG